MSPGEAMNQQARLIPLLRRRGVAGAGMVGTGCFGVPSPPPRSHRGAVAAPGAAAGTWLGGGVLITVISRVRVTSPIVSEDPGES